MWICLMTMISQQEPSLWNTLFNSPFAFPARLVIDRLMSLRSPRVLFVNNDPAHSSAYPEVRTCSFLLRWPPMHALRDLGKSPYHAYTLQNQTFRPAEIWTVSRELLSGKFWGIDEGVARINSSSTGVDVSEDLRTQHFDRPVFSSEIFDRFRASTKLVSRQLFSLLAD